ncbi:putative HTH-type transcriptional regulator YvdT [Mycobacteroides salmoniphilum]|uniref:HTH-type transcriptional regulator YvdT n=2 Tax=Mycobacteroides salmoniphilum TaxID=404941 RepID=A0A4R8SAI7_9MYCO|nr:putative HTH-type transcriptional regulator YvdT [Mycobacteroides salmoniphilum]TEA00900.1 putative HTH-type transcriptional regulator YvdT [Mycobacteroides salmoniphilum]
MFVAKGYHETSITDIATAANLSRGTFYLHFQSKRELLDAVFDYMAANAAARLTRLTATQPLESMSQVSDLVADMIDSSFGVHEEFPDGIRALLRDGLLDEQIAQRIFGMGDVFEAFVAMRVSEAITTGLVRSDLDPEFMAQVIGSMAGGTVLRILRGRLTRQSRDDYLKSLIDFFSLLTRTTS